MAHVTASISQVDAQFQGLSNESLQATPIVLDVYTAIPDDDDVQYTFAAAGDTYMPPRLVQVYRHTGGDITNTTPAGTYAVTTGETIIFQIDTDGSGTFTQFTHTTTGLSAEAATAAQFATSINADTAINPYVFAVAGLTTNAVTLFPKKIRGAVRIVGGTAVGDFAWPGTTADYKARTYVSQSEPILTAGTGWSYSYVASTRVLTVKNETGGTVNRVTILVWR